MGVPAGKAGILTALGRPVRGVHEAGKPTIIGGVNLGEFGLDVSVEGPILGYHPQLHWRVAKR